MRLEDCAAEIRPRRPWEAVDLGCALVREWAGPLFKSWMLTVFPVSLLFWAVMWNHPLLFVLVLWWIRPVFERVPLHVLSRSLFGEVPSPRSVAGLFWRKLLWRPFWLYWFGIRFQTWFSRSLRMPLRDLEGLDGMHYTQRSRIIERHAGHTATVITFACLLMEMALLFGLVLLVLSLIPKVFMPGITVVFELFFQSGPAAVPMGVWRLAAFLSILSMGVMQVIYVAAGFGLYTNSRSHVEGWDIELAFRRIANRLASALVFGLLGIGVLATMAPAPLLAQEGLWDRPEDGLPEATIEDVLEDPDFFVRTKTLRTMARQQSRNSLSIPGLEIVGYILFGLLVAALVAGIVYLIVRYGKNLVPRTGSEAFRDPGPSSVMGMDIAPESLPDDILSTARSLWESGQSQEAVSLLYRGAISHLVNREHLPIRESDTENDCLRHSRGLEDKGLVAYFGDLTRAWITTAYARRLPTQDTMDGLLSRWPFTKGVPA